MFQARATAPNRRHLFLGQALLLGLFLLAGLSAAASLSQNPLSCAAFRLVGLPAALVFAALLVKCVFLLSLNSGVYLPAPYQVRLNRSRPDRRPFRYFYVERRTFESLRRSLTRRIESQNDTGEKRPSGVTSRSSDEIIPREREMSFR